MGFRSESERRHRDVPLAGVAATFGDRARAEVFLLALDGLLPDDPSPAFLTQRTQLPVARFIAHLPELGGLS